MIERPITVFLVSDTFWNHVQGQFTWGKGFQYQDFIGDAPYAVITPQALEFLSGKNVNPSQIQIEGRPFQIVGEYSFSREKAKENAVIILPMGALKLLGSEKKTYLNRFLVKNKDGKGLDRLKKTIDYIQLKSGFTPSRPEFEVEIISPSSSVVSAYQKGLVPSMVALYGIFLVALVSSLHFMHRTLNSYNPIVVDRLIAGWQTKPLSTEIWLALVRRYLKLTVFCSLAMCIALALVGEHLQMLILPSLSVSLLFALSAYPLIGWFVIKGAVHRQQMILFSEGLFPLPGKWDIDRSA